MERKKTPLVSIANALSIRTHDINPRNIIQLCSGRPVLLFNGAVDSRSYMDNSVIELRKANTLVIISRGKAGIFTLCTLLDFSILL